MPTIKVFDLDKDAKVTQRLKELQLSDIGANEPQDLEAWIAGMGSEAFDREVLWLSRQDTPNLEGRSDLMGIDERGAVVVAELKNGTVTEEAVTQAMVYAAAYRELDLDDLAELYAFQSSKSGSMTLVKTASSLVDARSQIEQLVAADEDQEINEQQIIFLIGADFSARCLSVCEYLADVSDGTLALECWQFQVFGEVAAPKLVVSRVFPSETTKQLVETKLDAARATKKARDPMRKGLTRLLREGLRGSDLDDQKVEVPAKRGAVYNFEVWLKPLWGDEERGCLSFGAERGEAPYLHVDADLPKVDPPEGVKRLQEEGDEDWYFEWPEAVLKTAEQHQKVLADIRDILERMMVKEKESGTDVTEELAGAPSVETSTLN